MELISVILTDFTGEQDASLFILSLLPSGVLLTLLTLNLPFFLIELACLRLLPDEEEDICIAGGTMYGMAEFRVLMMAESRFDADARLYRNNEH